MKVLFLIECLDEQRYRWWERKVASLSSEASFFPFTAEVVQGDVIWNETINAALFVLVADLPKHIGPLARRIKALSPSTTVLAFLKDEAFESRTRVEKLPHDLAGIFPEREAQARLVDVIESSIAELYLDGPAPGFPQTLFGRFEILSWIKGDAEGLLYRCRDLGQDGRPVTVWVSSGALPTDDPRRQKLAQRLTALGDICHTNLVCLIGTFLEEPEPGCVFEELPPSALDSNKPSSGTMGENEQIFLGLCHGVAGLHMRNFVHGALTQSLVYPTAGGGAKVFWFPASFQSQTGGAPSRRNSPALGEHVAPEYLDGGSAASLQADVFAVGSIGYWLFSGQLPWTGRSLLELLEARLHAVPRPLTEISPSVPAGVADVIHKALSRDPADRYCSCVEMFRALERKGSGR